VTIRPASDRSLLVSFGEEITLDAHHHVAHLTQCLDGVRGILNLHPAFTTVLVDFDPRLLVHAQVERLIHERFASAPRDQSEQARTVEIPVRFGGEDGPDLGDVSSHTGLPAGRVIQLFCAAEYRVFFIGFSTCFPYLGGLPAELATPRLSAPRKHVPEGSVAIGGSQAGVYPLASPGGWRLIGRTALRLFDPQGSPPSLLRMGDRVRFVGIAEPPA
jgi:KipI family sensor histidine kinase inhibitor